MNVGQRVAHHKKRVRPVPQGIKSGRDILPLPDLERMHRDAEVLGHRLDRSQLRRRVGNANIGDDRNPLKPRHDFAQELNPFADDVDV
jgi:hypothetical protein